MSFPQTRLRRMRRLEPLRRMVRETRLAVGDLIAPLIVRGESGVFHPIPSMPGVAQASTDRIADECAEIESMGIPAALLFAIPERAEAPGSLGCTAAALMQRTLRAIRERCEDLVLIADVRVGERIMTSSGGSVVRDCRGDPIVDHQATLGTLAEQAVSFAAAGADVVAPSCMVDGMVKATRGGLDSEGWTDTAILSCAAEYASAYHGPFRQAAESVPVFADRMGHQMDPANAEEALREVALDVEEGADMVMVKPAVNYLDIIRRVKDRFGLPTVAFHASGEYAMIKAAAEHGWLDERRCVLETTTSIKRAGANVIVTYFAKEIARWLG